MSAEIIDLAAARRSLRLRAALADLHARLAGAPLPTPEELGWTVIARDATGRPTRVFCPRYVAFAGYVPGDPGRVYLDYGPHRHELAMELDELLLGLETGCLPEPEAPTG